MTLYLQKVFKMLYVLKGFEAVLFCGGKKEPISQLLSSGNIERRNTNKQEQTFPRVTFPKAIFIQSDNSDFNLIKR